MGGIKGDTILINYIKSKLLCRQAAEPTTVKKQKKRKKMTYFRRLLFSQQECGNKLHIQPFCWVFSWSSQPALRPKRPLNFKTIIHQHVLRDIGVRKSASLILVSVQEDLFADLNEALPVVRQDTGAEEANWSSINQLTQRTAQPSEYEQFRLRHGSHFSKPTS